MATPKEIIERADQPLSKPSIETSKDTIKNIDQHHPQFITESSKDTIKSINPPRPQFTMGSSKDNIKKFDKPHSKPSMKISEEQASSNNDHDSKFISCMGGFFRFMQLGLASAAVGLYGLDLSSSDHAKASANPWWIHAITVASVSVFLVLIYSIPAIRSRVFWFLDLLLFIQWFVVFGRFALLSLRYEAPAVNKVSSEIPKWSDPLRMFIVVWVDLANMCLWLVTGACQTLLFILRRDDWANENYAV